jgi:hypothetical protein
MKVNSYKPTNEVREILRSRKKESILKDMYISNNNLQNTLKVVIFIGGNNEDKRTLAILHMPPETSVEIIENPIVIPKGYSIFASVMDDAKDIDIIVNYE